MTRNSVGETLICDSLYRRCVGGALDTPHPALRATFLPGGKVIFANLAWLCYTIYNEKEGKIWQNCLTPLLF